MFATETTPACEWPSSSSVKRPRRSALSIRPSASTREANGHFAVTNFRKMDYRLAEALKQKPYCSLGCPLSQSRVISRADCGSHRLKSLGGL